MAETTAKTTTPRKPRATPRAAATAKPAASKPAPAATPAEDDVQRIQVTLGEMSEETKSYAKFNLKYDSDGNDTGMVGTLYAPLGTRTVKILLVGDELAE